MSTPPAIWTGTVVDVEPGAYAANAYTFGSGFITSPPGQPHTCNRAPFWEILAIAGAEAQYSLWCAINAGQPQLYLRRGENPNWAWIEVAAGAGNKWTKVLNPQNLPVHYWRLVANLWHYQYSENAWRFIGHKTMTPVQLYGGCDSIGNEFCCHDGASEPCGPSGPLRGWVPHQVTLDQCGPFGYPPTLHVEWSLGLPQTSPGDLPLYRAVA
jgi:hypothetical protein